jgi:hypothetical protein
MKPYSKNTIDRFCQSIIEDEFDDSEQNHSIYLDKVSGFDTLTKLLDFEMTGSQTILNVGAGSGASISFPYPVDMYFLEPNVQRGDRITNQKVILGWCENIAVDISFDMVICWGTMCFVRSVPETLIQFNDRLRVGGMLVLDVVKSTNLALAQTTNPRSFIGYASLFGFDLYHWISFGHSTHQREGFRFVKVRDFDPRYLRMPQAKGGVRNFLFERDWSLA